MAESMLASRQASLMSLSEGVPRLRAPRDTLKETEPEKRELSWGTVAMSSLNDDTFGLPSMAMVPELAR